MLFLSLHFIGKFPFKDVFLHGLLKNSKGEKMSKSLENGILPEDLYKQYDSDVIRMAFLMHTNYDREIRYGDHIFKKSSLFLHKLKNIFTYLVQKIEYERENLDFKIERGYKFEALSWCQR
ncbi:hypothetical protein PVNG_02347 [Plasmodium vivax North Korean]|uniref:valine--tRNA ligase n=1 Tax=Plasmodium vivax North Korean TaxID=1035514 RepID=A0A0J9TLL6_PLAVI|nr:hypothetical protein PVNG_02347 [Plasmodium vivax North Korean]